MFCEALESRTLLSVSALNPTIKADQLQIRSDLLKFKSDLAAGTAIIITDCAAMKADGAFSDPTLHPLFKQFHMDVRSQNQALKLDRLNQSAASLLDQSHIVADIEKILQDKGNKTAEAADHAQLLTDRIALQTDDLTGLNNRLTTRQNDFTTISSDLSAIATAVESDSGASAQLMADVEKFVTDRTTFLNTITADINTLIADRTKFMNDLQALQSQPAT
jgi:hypothetical protein